MLPYFRHPGLPAGSLPGCQEVAFQLKQDKVYEPLDRWDVESRKCVLTLEKYTRANRARILFNHVFFSALPRPTKLSLLANRGYARIVDHGSFSPRLIDAILARAERAPRSCSDLVGALLSALDNPTELWRHAFENQISGGARALLTGMVGLSGEVELGDAHEAADAFRRSEAERYGGHRADRELERAVKELDGSFVRLVRRRHSERVFIEFGGPGVRDFMEAVVRESPDRLIMLLESAPFFEQLSNLWGHTGVSEDAATPFRQLLKCEGARYAAALDRSFEARSPEFVQYESGTYPRKTTLKRKGTQPVARLAFLVTLAREAEMTSHVMPVLHARLPREVARTQFDSDEPETLAQALGDLRNIAGLTLDVEGLASTLMSTLRREPYPVTAMFSGIVVLLREFEPTLGGQRTAVREEFAENVPGEIDVLLDNCNSNDDLGWVEDGLMAIGSIGEELAVDVSTDLESAKSRLEAIMAEFPLEEDSDEWGGSSYRSSSKGAFDEDIDEMFGHLRDGGE